MPRLAPRSFLVALIAWLVLGSGAPAAPAPGAAGFGDPYFPQMGDGGYLAEHYAIDVTVDVANNRIAATTTITARATQDLSAFDLDFTGPPVSGVAVDGQPAANSRSGGKLVVAPRAPLANGQTFTVAVAYAGTPDRKSDPDGEGWTKQGDEIFAFGEPTGAETWFPVNNHPADKATYTLRVTVPKPYDVAAGGTLKSLTDAGSARTFVWEARDPMASYLVALHIGRLDEVTAVGPHGLPIRDFFPHDLPAAERAPFDRLPAMIAYDETVFGPYPFEVAGATVVDAAFGAALETQTLSTHSRDATDETVVAHELAHQWFGDSVGLRRWQDIWLNEGFATYAEWLWTEHTQGAAARDAAIRQAYAILAARDQLTDPARRAKLNAKQLVDLVLVAFPGLLSRQEALTRIGVKTDADLARLPASAALPKLGLPAIALTPVKIGDPGSDGLFRGAVYLRGAMTLEALRLKVGDDRFFRILRTYTARYRDGAVTTEDFVAVADEVAGQDLHGFFAAWLDQTALPPLPALGLAPAS